MSGVSVQIRRWRRVLEHRYRVAILGAAIATWPRRRVQAALGRDDELLVVACKVS